MLVPVMSAGIRSGVNWIRLNQVEHIADRAHQPGLAETGHALEQDVTAGKQRDQDFAHDCQPAR